MKDIGSETSPYVDTLMKEFKLFQSRYQSDKRYSSGQHLGKQRASS